MLCASGERLGSYDTGYKENTTFDMTSFDWAVFKGHKEPHNQIKKIIWFAAVAFIAVSIFIQSSASHHEWEYKNDLVLRYQDRYEERMIRERVEAATAINIYLQKGNWDAVSSEDTDSLEDVLAFYDELGFYWKNHEVSTDVLYEHFYSDMRTYCQVGIKYIQANQKTDSPADWEYVEPLFNELTKMEAKRIGKDASKCVLNNLTIDASVAPVESDLPFLPATNLSINWFNVVFSAVESILSKSLIHVASLRSAIFRSVV
jgi:hypothetical protein